MPPIPDSAAVRAALTRQIALLRLARDHLGEAARTAHPFPLDEWRGPAAASAARFVDDLRASLARAEAAVDDAVRRLQLDRARIP